MGAFFPLLKLGGELDIPKPRCIVGFMIRFQHSRVPFL
jgi:hypothetical protein